MIRILFEYILPLIAPFLVYFGWIWFAAALVGCTIGIRLRPLFGLSRE